MTHQVEARYRFESAQEPTLLLTPGDVDNLIDELLAGPSNENVAQLHARERERLPSGDFDHELLVGVDRELYVGVLAFMDAEGNVVSVGPPGGRSDPTYWIMRYPREFLGIVDIPIDTVRTAVKEFLASGGRRPTCVQWQEEDW